MHVSHLPASVSLQVQGGVLRHPCQLRFHWIQEAQVSAAEALSAAACQFQTKFEGAQSKPFANGVQTSKAVAGFSIMITVSAAAERQTWAIRLILRSNSCRF